MYVLVAGFRSRFIVAVPLCAALCGGCGDSSEPKLELSARDASTSNSGNPTTSGCNFEVEIDGDTLIKHVDEVTARFTIGEPYTKTVMLFGGEPWHHDNAVSNVYIIGLDKQDAVMLAEKYPDIYVCGSPGELEARNYYLDYDLVPASCDVYKDIVTALQVFDRNRAAGGDRTSLRLEGAALELESVIRDSTGEDVTDQLFDSNFHVITSVEQLTGESVLSFATNP